MLSRPLSASRRKHLFIAGHKRRRVAAAPAGVPLAGTGGDDTASREVFSLSRSLHVPPSKQVLRSIITVSSDASGDILQAYSTTDPSHSNASDPFSAATNWSALSSIYDLYKPESAILEWFPILPNNSSTVNATAPIVVAFDADSAPSGAVPTTEDTLLQYENARTFDVFRRWRYVVKNPKRVGSAAAGWLDVGAPTVSPASLMVATTLLAASTAYGRMVITLVCKFKSTR